MLSFTHATTSTRSTHVVARSLITLSSLFLTHYHHCSFHVVVLCLFPFSLLLLARHCWYSTRLLTSHGTLFFPSCSLFILRKFIYFNMSKVFICFIGDVSKVDPISKVVWSIWRNDVLVNFFYSFLYLTMIIWTIIVLSRLLMTTYNNSKVVIGGPF